MEKLFDDISKHMSKPSIAKDHEDMGGILQLLMVRALLNLLVAQLISVKAVKGDDGRKQYISVCDTVRPSVLTFYELGPHS